jgi:hypothetical protein
MLIIRVVTVFQPMHLVYIIDQVYRLFNYLQKVDFVLIRENGGSTIFSAHAFPTNSLIFILTCAKRRKKIQKNRWKQETKHIRHYILINNNILQNFIRLFKYMLFDK